MAKRKYSDEERKPRKKICDKKYYEKNSCKIKEGVRRYGKENLETIRKKAALWRSKNSEHIVRVNSARYLKNKESIKLASKKWSQENKEKRSVIWRRWYESNKLKSRKNSAAWCKRNPVSCKNRSHRRRARKRNSKVGCQKTIITWEKKWRSNRYCVCYWCRERHLSSKCHCDHIIPISKGGSHSIENLCISCAPCNFKKGALDMSKWNLKIIHPSLL